MSDPKRAILITAGAPKSAKNNVSKSLRLSINLEKSTESKYPELNYKELLIASAAKERQQNGETAGLDPFSDNDDDVELVARKFEQKYGGKSIYGKKSKHDEFADIGAGYDENDSFIDNTDGYDEMIPPGSDTLRGGFYINSGSLEFKAVPMNQSNDGDSNRRNKRRISSSSSDEDSDSSSDSDSEETKDPKAITNGTVDLHKTEHRKKKNKNINKKKAKKVRRTDSSAATSGKQTSDDNAQGDGESADSRTSQSDSLTSKPAPSSETAITSDSSRDAEAKVDIKLPEIVSKLLEELETLSQQTRDNQKDDNKTDQFIIRVERALALSGAAEGARRAVYARAARPLRVARGALLQRALALRDRALAPTKTTSDIAQSTTANTNTTISTTTTTSSTTNNSTTTNSTTNSTATTAITNNKRKVEEVLERLDVDRLTPEEKELKIVEALEKLKVLIEERKPGMMATYNAECERVQEEKKKLQIASAGEGAAAERRLPKRRFPWCARARELLARLAALAGAPAAAAALLCARALPLFPPGFVRAPTLLRQAGLSKDVKASALKRQRLGSASQSVVTSAQFSEPIQFPSSLTVTTSVKSYEKPEEDKDSKYKVNPAAVFGSIMNSYTLNKDLVIETPDDRKKELDRSKEDSYIPNNIGSITITPVLNSQKDKKVNSTANEKTKEPLIRVKSPAALNEMIHKKEKEKHKKPEKPAPTREKQVQSPLHIDTNYQMKKSSPSPKATDEVTQKQIETMRIAENNLPRPGLVSVHHSPTFAKPDKRPPEVKKKKDILIVSDMDPLADIPQEPLAVDDSSSDVEVVEDKSDKNELRASDNKSVTVPLKDKVSDNHRKVNSVKQKSDKSVDSYRECRRDLDEENDIANVMRNIREMEHSQEPTKLKCNSYGGVITSAKSEASSKQAGARPAPRAPRSDKFAE